MLITVFRNSHSDDDDDDNNNNKGGESYDGNPPAPLFYGGNRIWIFLSVVKYLVTNVNM